MTPRRFFFISLICSCSVIWKKCLLGESFRNRGWNTAVSPRCQFFPYPCWRTPSRAHSNLVPDAFVSRPRFVRAWEQMRVRLAPRALTNIGNVFPCRQDRQANLAQKTGGPCAKAGKMRWRDRRRLWGIVRRDDDFSVSFSLVSRYRRTAAIPARSWA